MLKLNPIKNLIFSKQERRIVNYKFMTALIIFSVVGLAWSAVPDKTATAGEKLRYSCSAQVFEAFETNRLTAFTSATGIDIDLHVGASYSSILRLMNGLSDIASSSQRLYLRHKEKGFIETLFCRDPLAVITNTNCSIDDISTTRLQDIFSGRIKNWKELGGPDQAILVVVPGKETAAYRNFDRLVMKRDEINYDCLTYQSTTVLDIVRHHPWAVAFISNGAAMNHPSVKRLRIDGVTPEDKAYPYSQVFSYVTKGTPAGMVKQFIDFTLTIEGRKMIRDRGMIPMGE